MLNANAHKNLMLLSSKLFFLLKVGKCVWNLLSTFLTLVMKETTMNSYYEFPTEK